MIFPKSQLTVRHLEEPHIEVGEGIAIPEPKMGWTLVGPLGSQSAIHEINLGLIGDAESLEKTKELVHRLDVITYGKDKSLLHVDFPGLERLRIQLKVRWTAEIDAEDIKQRFEKTTSFSERVEIASRVIGEKVKSLVERDPSPEVLVLAYPKIVDYYCIERAIGQRGVPRKTDLEKFIEKMRLQHRTLEYYYGGKMPERVFRPVDLRSIVKAICMEQNVPIQILRPYTVESYNPDRPRREDDATTFWNLIVALFYKSNRLPWRVRGLVEDTCYLGVAFFRDKDDSTNVKTALAQVFSLDSEGFVFKGEKAVIDDANSAHVSKEEAKKLVKYAVDVYFRNKQHLPRRIVVHKTSRYDRAELEGFKEGAEGVQKLALVAFGERGIKLLRWGQQPAPRGTMVKLPDGSVLLYTFGYIPYLGVYPGPRVPSPLEILEYHGDVDIETICKEILALTKLNWNNAKFCSKSPITVGFARRVGGILRQAPPDAKVGDRFKFYM